MKTIILPGFSLKNKDWAYQTKDELTPKFDVEVIEWDHWTTGNTDFPNWEAWLSIEVPRVLGKIGEEKVNILAKSIGTLVAMNILKSKPDLVNKVILCGIPLNDIEDVDKEAYKVLPNFPEDKILVIQNENDNHGNFAEAEKFIHAINPKIKIISKPRDDHNYPYPEESIRFLN